MSDLDTLYENWTEATASLPYGVQRVFHDVFVLASEGKTTLIYGRDYRDGKPCLVNTVGVMLRSGGGYGVPTRHFGKVVGLFDEINRELFNVGVNTETGYVSQLAADILKTKFAPLKDAPETPEVTSANYDSPYREPTDEEIAKDISSWFQGDDTGPCEITFSDDLRNVTINDGHFESNEQFSNNS